MVPAAATFNVDVYVPVPGAGICIGTFVEAYVIQLVVVKLKADEYPELPH